MSEFKTNVMRMLDKAKVKYNHYSYADTDAVSGTEVAELLPLTGYVHGGCSPIGMKKFFTTVIDISAQNFETIIFSAGKIGYQVELSLDDLCKVIKFELKEVSCQA